MEKLLLASQMATRWTDPTIVLVMLIPVLVVLVGTFVWGTYSLQTVLSAEAYNLVGAWENQQTQVLEATAFLTVPSLLLALVYNFWYHSGDACDDTEA